MAEAVVAADVVAAMIGCRRVYPVLLPFPIWRYGSIYGRLDGRYVRDGWWPDPYAVRVVRGSVD